MSDLTERLISRISTGLIFSVICLYGAAVSGSLSQYIDYRKGNVATFDSNRPYIKEKPVESIAGGAIFGQCYIMGRMIIKQRHDRKDKELS